VRCSDISPPPSLSQSLKITYAREKKQSPPLLFLVWFRTCGNIVGQCLGSQTAALDIKLHLGEGKPCVRFLPPLLFLLLLPISRFLSGYETSSAGTSHSSHHSHRHSGGRHVVFCLLKCSVELFRDINTTVPFHVLLVVT